MVCVNAPVLTDLGRAPTPRMGYPLGVPRISPTVEGFRAAFRRLALLFAEILWRWSVGASAAALIIFGVIEYLNTLPVTAGQILFLQTNTIYSDCESDRAHSFAVVGSVESLPPRSLHLRSCCFG